MKKNFIALFFIVSCMINTINASITLNIENKYKDKDIELLIENSALKIKKTTKTINSNGSLSMTLTPEALKKLSSSMWIKTKYELHWHKGIQEHLQNICDNAEEDPNLTATIKITASSWLHFGYQTSGTYSSGGIFYFQTGY